MTASYMQLCIGLQESECDLQSARLLGLRLSVLGEILRDEALRMFKFLICQTPLILGRAVQP